MGNLEIVYLFKSSVRGGFTQNITCVSCTLRESTSTYRYLWEIHLLRGEPYVRLRSRPNDIQNKKV